MCHPRGFRAEWVWWQVTFAPRVEAFPRGAGIVQTPQAGGKVGLPPKASFGDSLLLHAQELPVS